MGATGIGRSRPKSVIQTSKADGKVWPRDDRRPSRKQLELPDIPVAGDTQCIAGIGLRGRVGHAAIDIAFRDCKHA